MGQSQKALTKGSTIGSELPGPPQASARYPKRYRAKVASVISSNRYFYE